MSMLNDQAIRLSMNSGAITVKAPMGVGDAQIQPASVDLRLGEVNKKALTRDHHGCLLWDIEPGEFVLASTLEVVGIGPALAGRVEGKSTMGRKGLQVHCAGFVDPGFEGEITLELKSLLQPPDEEHWPHDRVIRLAQGQLICQISFIHLTGPAERPYGHPDLRSHYQGQRGPTPAAP